MANSSTVAMVQASFGVLREPCIAGKTCSLVRYCDSFAIMRGSIDLPRLHLHKNLKIGRRCAVRVVNEATQVSTKTPAEAEWRIKRDALLKAKLRSVTPKEALKLQQEEGYTILDVRPEFEHNEAHPAGAVNVQVYRLIKEWTARDIARRAAFAFFGIFQGTEENPDFVKEVKDQFDKDSKIIVGCTAGGTVKPSPNLAEGSQSRSLIAAYILTLEGYTNVVHMEGGIRTWFKDQLPTDSVVPDQ